MSDDLTHEVGPNPVDDRLKRETISAIDAGWGCRGTSKCAVCSKRAASPGQPPGHSPGGVRWNRSGMSSALAPERSLNFQNGVNEPSLAQRHRVIAEVGPGDWVHLLRQQKELICQCEHLVEDAKALVDVAEP